MTGTRGAGSSAVHIDDAGRPHLLVGHGDIGAAHDVILERVRPVFEGFCQTCFRDYFTTRRAGRKARNCPLMVAYLSQVNRSRHLQRDLQGEIQRLAVEGDSGSASSDRGTDGQEGADHQL